MSSYIGALPGSIAVTIGDVFNAVQTNLFESNLKWFSEDDIYASIQEAYNKIVAILQPIEKATFIPQIGSPYYNFATQIPDFMYVAGIYNPSTLLWLEGMSYKLMKATYQTYLAIGNAQYYNIQDFRRLIIWPFNTTGSGVLFVVYKAFAPTIYRPSIPAGGQGMYDPDHVPVLPFSVALQLLEYFTTADLLEQAREFRKAKIWWDRLLLERTKQGLPSVMDQAATEIKDLARADRETVLEPYRWIFHGGASGNVTWINNETPAGTIDGVNTTFVLANVPNPSSSVLLTKNGQILYEATGYVLVGQTITFQTGYTPQPASSGDLVGDQLRAWYQVN